MAKTHQNSKSKGLVGPGNRHSAASKTVISAPVATNTTTRSRLLSRRNLTFVAIALLLIAGSMGVARLIVTNRTDNNASPSSPGRLDERDIPDLTSELDELEPVFVNGTL